MKKLSISFSICLLILSACSIEKHNNTQPEKNIVIRKPVQNYSSEKDNNKKTLKEKYDRYQKTAKTKTGRPTVKTLNTKIQKENLLISKLLERFTTKHPDVIYHKKYRQTLILKRDELLSIKHKHSQKSLKFSKEYVSFDNHYTNHRLQKTGLEPKILTKTNSLFFPDFSYAGYHWGEINIPDFKGKIFNVTHFGATPNDKADDTVAIKSALKAAHKYKGSAIILFPAGRFIISDILHIQKSNLVIRGNGGHSKSGTSLLVSRPLMEISKLPDKISKTMNFIIRENKKTNGKYYSPVSWTGGFIWANSLSKNKRISIANITSGQQGKHLLTYNSLKTIKSGTTMELVWCHSHCQDPDGLLNHAIDQQHIKIGSRTKKMVSQGLIRQTVTIVEVKDKVIKIKEPLLHKIIPEWEVSLEHYNPIREVGIESLQIIFPDTVYKGHLQEDGYNAIYFTKTAHSWIRDIYIKNADTGININKSKNITIEKITLKGREGHYSIVLSNSNDILVRNFNLYAKTRHGPSAGTASRRNVFTDGVIYNSPIDQHMSLNEQNLFDNLKFILYDAGTLFKHGGDSDRGPTSGAFSVFWNIDIQFETNPYITLKNAPSARLVGIHGSKKIKLNYKPNAYIEGLNQPQLQPASLYQYQLKNRLN